MFKKAFWALGLIAFIAAATSGVTPVQAAPAANTVGYMNVAYLIQHHPDTAAANAALKAEDEAARKEFAEKSANMSDQEKQNLDRDLVQRVGQKRIDLSKPIIDKIVAAAKEVADAKGLSIVLDAQQVVCGGVDITQDVLTKIGGK